MAKWDITKAKCPNCEETFQMYVDANEARIDAEAKLAKAVDVIEWALIAWDDHCKHGYNMQGDWVHDARTTFAELLKERSDEKGQD